MPRRRRENDPTPVDERPDRRGEQLHPEVYAAPAERDVHRAQAHPRPRRRRDVEVQPQRHRWTPDTADRGGARQSMALMCAVLAVAILLLAFGCAAWSPVLAIVLLGLVFSSIQAVFRSLYAGLIPRDKAAELFGFNSIAGRLSAALGPLLFGAAVAVLGSQTWALSLLLVPLAAGVALLLRADLPPAVA